MLADGGANTTFAFGMGDLGAEIIAAGAGGADTIDLSGLDGPATLNRARPCSKRLPRTSSS